MRDTYSRIFEHAVSGLIQSESWSLYALAISVLWKKETAAASIVDSSAHTFEKQTRDKRPLEWVLSIYFVGLRACVRHSKFITRTHKTKSIL